MEVYYLHGAVDSLYADLLDFTSNGVAAIK